MMPLTYLSIRTGDSCLTLSCSHPLTPHIEGFGCTRKYTQWHPRRDLARNVLAYLLTLSSFKRSRTMHFDAHDTHIMQLLFSCLAIPRLSELETKFILRCYTINLTMSCRYQNQIPGTEGVLRSEMKGTEIPGPMSGI